MVNLSVRFLLEIFALAVYGYWGFKVGNTGIMKGFFKHCYPNRNSGRLGDIWFP
ncbi:YrdB family protein [Peribacillus sp. NPDC096540]|uniref:YrdB family protein n=1 Tax=Peribacillus sp. NPDC096540 TaxID=3390612 RepID=UPI003CFF3EEE